MGFALPLTMNGGSASVSNAVLERDEHVVGGDDLAGHGLGHEPGREVHGVAHHGVGAPVPGADLTGEDVAAVDADANRQRQRLVDDAADGTQHASLVVAARHGHAGTRG